MRTFGHRGLALSTAIAALCNAAILLWPLQRRLEGIDGRRLLTALCKLTPASAVMAAAAYGTERGLRVPFAGDALIAQALRVFGAIATGLAVLAISAQILRVSEFTQSVRLVTDRLKRGASGV